MKQNFSCLIKKRLEQNNNFPAIIFFVFLTISIESCKYVPKEEGATKNSIISTESQIQHEDTRKLIISTRLDTLYLNNIISNPQLDILMNRTGSKEKLLCQFYLLDNGKITLGIFPSKKKNQGIDNARVQLLTNGGYSGLDVSSGKIYFGDQEISETEYNILKDIVNVAGHEFIIFIPKQFGNHIGYNILSGSSLSLAHLTPIGNTNPSPPKDAF